MCIRDSLGTVFVRIVYSSLAVGAFGIRSGDVRISPALEVFRDRRGEALHPAAVQNGYLYVPPGRFADLGLLLLDDLHLRAALERRNEPLEPIGVHDVIPDAADDLWLAGGSGHLHLAGPDSPQLQAQREPVSYTHLRAHETRHDLVCRLLLEKK